MPKNQLNKEELKVRIYKLKNKVDNEPKTVWQGEKDLAHKYLNRVLDIIDEYRYWLWKSMDLFGETFY